MAFCKNCGTELNEDAAFCPKCGTPQGAAQPAQDLSQNQYPNNQGYQYQTRASTIISITTSIITSIRTSPPCRTPAASAGACWASASPSWV